MLSKYKLNQLTPTYYVFEMYKRHQESTLVDCYIDVPMEDCEGFKIPLVSSSASVNEDGELTITFANTSLSEEIEISTEVVGNFASVEGTILTGKMDDFNSFEKDDVVKPAPFAGADLADGTLCVKLPACSVVTLVLR